MQANNQILVSLVKMATVLEYTTNEQSYILRFLMDKRLNPKDIHREMLAVEV
jgi:hypothetical protein